MKQSPPEGRTQKGVLKQRRRSEHAKWKLGTVKNGTAEGKKKMGKKF